MSDFFIKKNDVLPVVRAYLSDANGYIDLSGATVSFVYQDRQQNNAPITGSVSVISAPSGLVEFAWSSGIDVGTYFAEWRTVLSNGKQMSFPNDSHLSFEVVDNLN